MTPVGPGTSATRTITVLPASRATSREVGSLAWVVLEELALRAESQAEGLVVETSVRDLAATLTAGKDTIAAALGRLVDLGLVHHRIRRRAGRYAGSAYLIDADACRRGGLILGTTVSDRPCPVIPCPVEPEPADRDPAAPDTIVTAGPEPAPASPTGYAGSLAPSLFDPPEPPTSPVPTLPSLSSFPPSTPSIDPTSPPDPPSSPSSSLPTPNRTDALAPGVRGGAVNAAGSLNGNPDGSRDRC